MYTIVTKRTLIKWRKEALGVIEAASLPNIIIDGKEAEPVLGRLRSIEWSNRMLRLTAILLDQELMKGK